MSDVERLAPSEEERAAQVERLRQVWSPGPGWRYWLAVTNNQVGQWYLATAFAYFLGAGVLALLIRIQLWAPDNDFVSAETYNQLFSMHGTAMMFLFAVPIFEAVAVMLVPPATGSRELPFPRLSAYGFWSFLLGGTFVLGSVVFGAAPQGGWFMYPPMTTQYEEGFGPDIWMLGLTFIEIASISAAIELLVGILKCRTPGMTLDRMPLYLWYILVTATMILFAFPPLIVGDLLFELERLLDWPFFDPNRGGDPILWQHLFWIFGHPEVYIIFLPSIALVAMIVPTFARHPMVGYRWVVLAAVSVGFVSFGLWAHHMFATGLPNLSLAFFSAASEVVAIPTAIQIFCFIATIFAGRFIGSVPMLWCAGALFIFVCGGLTGVMVALAPFDFQAHDTYFVVAHLHYVLIGGMLFPVLAGITYYYPQFSLNNKMLSPRLGKWSFWLTFIGFNVTFMPMHFIGLAGMSRRIWTYADAPGFQITNQISTVGAFMIAAGIGIFVIDAVRPRRKQPLPPRNPWNAGTLEWVSPVAGGNWMPRTMPQISTRYPLWEEPDIFERVDKGVGYMTDADDGFRETLITSPIDARPQYAHKIPSDSPLPLLAAIATGGVFIFSTFHWWIPTGISFVVALALILTWVWTGTGEKPPRPEKDVGLGLIMPMYASGPKAVGWWATIIAMIADSSAYAALIFGYFYYWTLDADFPMADAPGVVIPGAAMACAVIAWLTLVVARRLNRADRRLGFYAAMLVGIAANVGALAFWALMPKLTGLDPTQHVYPAIVAAFAVWLGTHHALGLLLQLYVTARRIAGRMDAVHDAEIQNSTLFWHLIMASSVLAFGVLALFPLA